MKKKSLRQRTLFFAFLFAALFESMVLASDSQSLQQFVLSQKLYHDKQWLRLLHYEKTIFGGYKSRADESTFFISSSGDSDPQSELSHFIKKIFSAESGDQHPFCRFPARTQWLKEKVKSLSGVEWPVVNCPKRDEFLKAARAESVYLVFSSYYLNNPSSTFGHSFIRLGRSYPFIQSKEKELLDNGINYAANPGTKNPIFYALGGIFGSFRGNFALMPYFYKVREYNDFESRDLWSYKLNLTDDERNMLLAHFWELDQGGFRYYFFDENCSYYMLAALEAIAPRYDLLQRLPWGWAIPADTLKAVAEEDGLISEVTYRPSNRTVFRQQISKLSIVEKKVLEKIVKQKSPEPLEKLSSPQQKASVLDAAIADYDLNHVKDVLKEKKIQPWRKKLLIQRAKLGIASNPVRVEKPESLRPDQGHDSRRFAVGFGYDSEKLSYIELNPRFAFHDLLDPSVGFPEGIQLELMNFNFRYFLREPEQESRVRLESWSFLSLASIDPIRDLEKNRSWLVNLGARRVLDQNCEECLMGFAAYSYGLTWKFNSLLVSTLADATLGYSDQFFDSHFRVELGPQLHFLWQGKVNWVFKTSYHYLLFSQDEHLFSAELEARKSLHVAMMLGLYGKVVDRRNEIGAKLYYYF